LSRISGKGTFSTPTDVIVHSFSKQVVSVRLVESYTPAEGETGARGGCTESRRSGAAIILIAVPDIKRQDSRLSFQEPGAVLRARGSPSCYTSLVLEGVAPDACQPDASRTHSSNSRFGKRHGCFLESWCLEFDDHFFQGRHHIRGMRFRRTNAGLRSFQMDSPTCCKL
jgi:hypothetical protein